MPDLPRNAVIAENLVAQVRAEEARADHADPNVEACGGKVRVIASIEDPVVIGRILGHMAVRAALLGSRPPARGPPPGEFGFH